MTVASNPLYLSRLILDLRSRRVWSELAQPYEMHRTLMRGFPLAKDEQKAKARNEFGVLFRADVEEHRQRVLVYIQSAIEPNWSFLDSVGDYLLADPDPPKEIGKAYRKLQEGQILSFRLRANPTRRVWNSKPGTIALRGQRVRLCTEMEQTEWLIRKGRGEPETGKPGGFEILTKDCEDQSGNIGRIPHVIARREGKQTGRKRDGGEPQEMTHWGVCFDGALRITDADAFRQTLASGIGPAKAFGFGLLSIAPLRPDS